MNMSRSNDMTGSATNTLGHSDVNRKGRAAAFCDDIAIECLGVQARDICGKKYNNEACSRSFAAKRKRTGSDSNPCSHSCRLRSGDCCCTYVFIEF
ncbi:hypothetical protein E2542_SST22600 [Spatholobus suberectus]|nr:hypothetical protein E2542_SST22600 [Spatholobus suberectus]